LSFRIHGQPLWYPSADLPSENVTLEADRPKCQLRAEIPTSLVVRQRRN
jgi:hypothetical protein